MIKSVALCVFLVFIWGVCCSQTVIEGYIKDIAEKNGVFASVVLKNENGKIITYTNSKYDGKFSLTTTQQGRFILNVSSLSYEAYSKEILIEPERNLTIEILLNPAVTELKEMVIKQVKPIMQKGDTIVFDAKSFAQGNEQVIEDLLKKIPGLNVLSDGTIKVGNQEVEKVMVDGDDFFERGYKLLTKNMPVNPIDKIEVHQRYSNNRHLKGIENTEKVALNLTLKEDAKRVWFGNASVGYGNKYRHEIRGNLMNFGKKSKYYALTNLNNTGLNAVGDINHLIRPFRLDEPASVGDNQSANTLLSLTSDLPNLNLKRVNLNNARMLSLNAILTLSENIKLKTLGFLNTDKTDFFRNSFQEFSVGTSAFQNREDMVVQKSEITGFGKMDLTYDISKTKTLEYIGKFNRTHLDNKSDLTFNGDLLNENLQNRNELADHKLVYTSKLNEHKVILITARHINEKTPQNYSLNKYLYPELLLLEGDSTLQKSRNNMRFTGAEAHFLNKIANGDLLEIRLGN